MTLKRHWWSAPEDPKLCKRKRHASYEAAVVALSVIKQQGFGVNSYAMKLHPAACKTCRGWHLVKK